METKTKKHPLFTPVKFMTWNVLAQSLAHGFDDVDEKVLEAKNRIPRILKTIKRHNPDVLCLQEVDEPILKAIDESKLPYTRLAVGTRRDEKHSVCLYMRDTSHASFSGAYPIDDNRFAVQSYIKGGGVVMSVDTFHLSSKDKSEERKAQLEKILEANEDRNVPMFLMGDFNTTPDDPLIQRVVKSGAFKCLTNKVTTKKKRNGEVVERAIDLILYRDAFPADIVVPDTTELLPNEHNPSDHVPVVAIFFVKRTRFDLNGFLFEA